MSGRKPPVLAFKKIDDDLPDPEYMTAGSVGFDLYTREDSEIEPGAIALLPLNVIAKVPSGFVLFVNFRSSTPKRYGISVPHGMGVIDRDYHGNDDEVSILALNYTDDIVRIERGSRIAQGVVVYGPRIKLQPGYEPQASRGGFGSTG